MVPAPKSHFSLVKKGALMIVDVLLQLTYEPAPPTVAVKLAWVRLQLIEGGETDGAMVANIELT